MIQDQSRISFLVWPAAADEAAAACLRLRLLIKRRCSQEGSFVPHGATAHQDMETSGEEAIEWLG